MTLHIGIDPGTRETGVATLLGDTVPDSGILPNEELPAWLENLLRDYRDTAAVTEIRIGIEMIACYGMPVGKDVFETILWIGHFITRFSTLAAPPCKPQSPAMAIRKVYRMQVKSHLCHSAKAKDPNIRQAIIDLFPPSGGGRTPQIGTNPQPGPLYGIKSHAWAALGVALTARDTWDDLEPFTMISQPLPAAA